MFPDTHGDLLDWTTKIINSVRLAVETEKVKIYPGSWKGTRVRLHLDIEEGLKLYTGDDKVIHFYPLLSMLTRQNPFVSICDPYCCCRPLLPCKNYREPAGVSSWGLSDIHFFPDVIVELQTFSASRLV